MRTRMAGSAIAISTAACFAASSLAADDASVKKDLFTVITLQGLPCGEVVSVTTKGNNDHIATCKDGNRYQIHDVWADGPEGLLGTTVAGFPNLFTMIGPNTGLGHSSMVYMVESQTR